MLTLNPEARELRRVLGRFATGVTVLSRTHRGTYPAMTANAFMPLSLDPPLVAVSIRKEAGFLDDLAAGQEFGISFLCEDQQHVARYYASRDRGASGDYLDVEGEVPFVKDASDALIVKVVQMQVTGDHVLLISQVQHARTNADQRSSLVFHGSAYRTLLSTT